MRLWTLHPRYLDAKGLVAAWREALLAQKVLRGATRGYRHHPQLLRFQAQLDPRAAIAAFLRGIAQEADRRGYRFDQTKILRRRIYAKIPETSGQLLFEWRHLKKKLRIRAPTVARQCRGIVTPEAHPLFQIVPGKVKPWEKKPSEPRLPRARFVATSGKETMTQLLRFPGSVKRDPAIETWMKEHAGEFGAIAQHWFAVMRKCGGKVRELLHDGHPTACVADAGFAYVNAFKDHVNVGFFRGAEIADPQGLLEGTGKFMRHVKLTRGHNVNAAALRKLIESAYTDMKERVRAESLGAPSNEKRPDMRQPVAPSPGCS